MLRYCRAVIYTVGLLLFLPTQCLLNGQEPQPATATASAPSPAKQLVDGILNEAYASLRQMQYEDAIALFEKALSMDPARASVHKDVAYTLLKAGETEKARDHFLAAYNLQPSDEHAALEYAFLAFETRQPRQARRIFEKLSQSANAQTRATAAQAFRNVDQPLADGIARWQAALQQLPNNFSGHEELARLAEQRDLLPLAIQHYEYAWRLKPERRDLLLAIGRLKMEQGNRTEAISAFLAVTRGAEPHTAELARKELPSRYPYVSEFEVALRMDPGNTELHRELGYLLLELRRPQEAVTHFARIVEQDPADLLSATQLGFLWLKGTAGERTTAKEADPKALAEKGRNLLENLLSNDKLDPQLADRIRMALGKPQELKTRLQEEPAHVITNEAKALGARSLEKGYLKDALRYLSIAHETDPVDFDVMLKLGWTYNMMQKDEEAVRWFDLARRAPDEKTAYEAKRAYETLSSTGKRLQTTFWIFPLYSSRFQTAFAYSQVKADFKTKFPLRPYFSMRWIADARSGRATRNQFGATTPAYFSEASAILGMGIATPVKHGWFAWAEAGTAVSYLNRTDVARAISDYRGGVNLTRVFGHSLYAPKNGWFTESSNDAVFVSRFQNDVVFFTQNRLGWTFGRSLDQKEIYPFRYQLYLAANATSDAKRQYWASMVETGPGIRFRWASLPPSVSIHLQMTRGVYYRNAGNPGRPNFFDFRAGVWYAITR